MSEKVSLSQFVRDNYQLFTAVGVVGGLTTFFASLGNAPYLTFIAFAMFFLLTWELLDLFFKIEESSLRLDAFGFLVLFLFVAIGLYILYTYVIPFYQLFIFAFLLGLYFAVSIKLLDRFKLSERIHNRIKGKRYALVRHLTIFVGILALFVLTIISASYVIDFLEPLFP